MTDFTNLVDKVNIQDPVKALRERALRENEWYEHGGDIINAAADTIEERQKILKAVQKNSGINFRMWKEAQAEVKRLQAQLPKRGEWVHGREIGKEWVYDHWVTYYEDWHCSNCKVVFEQEEKPKHNYCPNCGAKMDGGKDDI